MRLLVLSCFVVVLAIGMPTACESGPTVTSSSVATTVITTTTETPTTEITSSTTGTGASTTVLVTTTTAGIPSDLIAYAESLGGTSHEGQRLYFVIGASVKTAKEARALLEDAIPRFGDMQSYFIVQRSDNFEGMNPGWWVVLEAYRNEPSQEDLQFGRRGFPDAYVKSATVNTSDPIPVYEDIVPGA